MEVIHKNLVETEVVVPDHIELEGEVSQEAMDAFKAAGELVAKEFFDYIYDKFSSLQHFRPKYVRITIGPMAWEAQISVYAFSKQVYHQIKDDTLSCINVWSIYNAEENQVLHCGSKSEVFNEAANRMYDMHQKYGTVSQDTEIRWSPEMCIEYLKYQMMCERLKPVASQAVSILINDWKDADEARERDYCYNKEDEG